MTIGEHPAESHHGAEDEAAIRQVVADFADAWNRHDPPAIVKRFSDDLDHVSVRGRWQQGRAELEQTYETSPGHPSHIWAVECGTEYAGGGCGVGCTAQ